LIILKGEDKMELKDCVRIVKGMLEGKSDATLWEYKEELKVILSFYQTVLEAHGLPDVKQITEIIWERVTNAGDPDYPILKSDSEEAANEIYGLWQAWLAKAVDVERIMER